MLDRICYRFTVRATLAVAAGSKDTQPDYQLCTLMVQALIFNIQLDEGGQLQHQLMFRHSAGQMGFQLARIEDKKGRDTQNVVF
jgi:hypothetical protein